jgi:hypothetical protein
LARCRSRRSRSSSGGRGGHRVVRPLSLCMEGDNDGPVARHEPAWGDAATSPDLVRSPV